MKPMKTITTNDFNTSRIQQNLQEFLSPLKENPLNSGVYLDSMKDENSSSQTFGKIIPITLDTSPLKIPHLLKRVPKGYLVLNQTSAASVFRIEPATSMDPLTAKRNMDMEMRFITLQASATVTVKLWLF